MPRHAANASTCRHSAAGVRRRRRRAALILALRPAWIGLVIAAAWLAAPTARAQDEASLRRELDRATAENARLTRELDQFRKDRDAALARAADLERDRELLRRELDGARARLAAAGLGPSVTDPEPPRADTPRDPLAAPAAMLAELRRRYEHDLATLPRTTPEEDEAFHDAAARWCRSQNARLRGRTEWLARFEAIEEPSADRRAWTARRTVLEEGTLLPIGDAERVEVPDRFAARLAASPDGLWRVTGMFIAAPVYDPERDQPGLFDGPFLVGPVVEFGYRFEWQTLIAAEAPADHGADPAPRPPEPSGR